MESNTTAGGLSKKKEKKAKKVNQKIKIPDGSVDFMVQHTNDDSVVSKRSAVQLRYFDDPFLRHFVKKPTRRSPLINRGYYLRMKVITSLVSDAVRHFKHVAAADSALAGGRPIQVISLGAGFDTLAFRLLLPKTTSDSTLAMDNVHFYDVDFPAVMQNKAALMVAAPPGSFPADWVVDPQRATLPVSSPHYAAVGVDLRDAEQSLLDRLSQASPSFSPANPTVLYAECMMQYMPSESACALLQLIARTFVDAFFAAYDQLCPGDSFGGVMQKSLKAKNSPLLGISAAPDGAAMVSRALSAGFRDAAFANFYDLSRHHIAGEELSRVAALEDFDEAEEWSEMCEHYGITLCTTSAEESRQHLLTSMPCFQRDPAADRAPTGEAVPASLHPWPTGRFGFEGWGNGGFVAETLDGSGGGDVLFLTFGGFAVSKGHQRVNTLFAHSLREGDVPVVSTGDVPPATVFHSFARLRSGVYVVFGGRTNPSNAFNAFYVVSVELPSGGAVTPSTVITASWARLSSDVAPPPRFRHSLVVLSPTHVLVMGGRDEAGGLLDDVWEGHIDGERRHITWACGKPHGDALPAHCSSAAVAVPSEGAVYVSGGLLANEESARSLWRLDVRDMQCSLVGGIDVGGRFSHSMCAVGDKLLILGGSTTDVKAKLDFAVLVDPSSEAPHTVSLQIPPGEHDWWSRHSAVCLNENKPQRRPRVAVMGGGYTCFSFGTFSSRPRLLCVGDTDAIAGDDDTEARAAAAPAARAPVNAETAAAGPFQFTPRPAVTEMEYSDEAFVRVATEARQPVVFRSVDLGPCCQRWADAVYLKSAEGGTTVSVHVAQGSHLLDFARKNFAFRHVPLSELVDHLVDAQAHYTRTGQELPETWYYRSVPTHMKTERSNIWTDFATLGKDFRLPAGAAAHILPRLQQSCLRLNAAPLQLWTHYDTADNVLCQIVGRKRVVLFPPSALNDLYMKGSSSLVLDPENADIARYPRFISAWASAVEVTLSPGDMLYFPANWFHHITTLPPGSASASATGPVASVNVFFRHFDESDCDPKDLYGNKNPPAVVQLQESIVGHAKQQLSTATLTGTRLPLPANYKQFALRLAIQELETIANTMNAENA